MPPEWNVYKHILDKNTKKLLILEQQSFTARLFYSYQKIMQKGNYLRIHIFKKTTKCNTPYKLFYYKKRWGFCISCINEYKNLIEFIHQMINLKY